MFAYEFESSSLVLGANQVKEFAMNNMNKMFLTAALIFVGQSAMAMPHDQPYLRFYSKGNVGVGLVYSPDADSLYDMGGERQLQEIYLCKDGKQINDFANFKTLAVQDGVFAEAKTTAGNTINLIFDPKNLSVDSSTLPALNITGVDPLSLTLKISGVNGFQVNWSDPCTPKPTDP